MKIIQLSHEELFKIANGTNRNEITKALEYLLLSGFIIIIIEKPNLKHEIRTQDQFKIWF